jgi:hypothetical protein
MGQPERIFCLSHDARQSVDNNEFRLSNTQAVEKSEERNKGKHPTKLKNGFLLKAFLHDKLMVVQQVKKFYAIMELQN